MEFNRRNLLAIGAGSTAGFFLAGRAGLAQTTGSVSREGSDIYYETHGDGPPIQLLHGGLGHSGWFEALRNHLVDGGYQAVLVDTRGMGRSALGDISLSYAAQEEDAHAVLDALGIESCPVIGFSDGGIEGYRMAARPNTRVSKLVTIGARWSAENGRGMWDTFDTWNRELLGSSDFSFIVEDYDRLNPDGDFDRMVTQAAAMWKDSGEDGHPEARIGEITIPVLVTVGDSDPFLSVADANAARGQMENATLLVVPGATHAAYQERPDVFLPALDAFLAA